MCADHFAHTQLNDQRNRKSPDAVPTVKWNGLSDSASAIPLGVNKCNILGRGYQMVMAANKKIVSAKCIPSSLINYL